MKKLILLMLTVCGLTGCAPAKKYVVNAPDFLEVKDGYAEGETVEIVYSIEKIVPDTEYVFRADGNEVDALWKDDVGYVLSFVMPAHDVDISIKTRDVTIADNPVKILYRRMWIYGLDVEITDKEDIDNVLQALDNVVVSNRTSDISVTDFTDIIVVYYDDGRTLTYEFEEYCLVNEQGVHYEVDRGLGELRAVLDELVQRKN